jgi:hypothetical protein
MRTHSVGKQLQFPFYFKCLQFLGKGAHLIIWDKCFPQWFFAAEKEHHTTRSSNTHITHSLLRCHACSKYAHLAELILWGGDRESNRIFKLQKQVLRVIYGVSSRMSCRQIFKDYNVLTLPSLYILEVIRFIKKTAL